MMMMMRIQFFVCFLYFTGLYTHHVFSAILERQKAFLFWNPTKSHARQQGS